MAAMKPTRHEGYLTTAEAAAELGVTIAWFSILTKRRGLKPTMFRWSVRSDMEVMHWSLDQVEQLRQRSTNQPPRADAHGNQVFSSGEVQRELGMSANRFAYLRMKNRLDPAYKAPSGRMFWRRDQVEQLAAIEEREQRAKMLA